MSELLERLVGNNEIKKALYRENPVAKFVYVFNGAAYYNARLESSGKLIMFEIPIADMANGHFHNEENSKHLIRWLVNDNK